MNRLKKKYRARVGVFKGLTWVKQGEFLLKITYCQR